MSSPASGGRLVAWLLGTPWHDGEFRVKGLGFGVLGLEFRAYLLNRKSPKALKP